MIKIPSIGIHTGGFVNVIRKWSRIPCHAT